ncbi:hypothetical protein LB465_13130 [Salegentibacter sp. LM13S]|uniref:hypothetical protein n=1 Tax=Salegentibacter lacus TaxID=2873599 RepID=UPI001CCAC179|nr:hypothetical protein [Salegentibacter lacus]MBZ9631726.1 hypothetical protein [Salegentibacter lacus]
MINIILALASIMLGLVLIVYYSGLKKEHKGGLTINLLGSGVGFIMIGVNRKRIILMFYPHLTTDKKHHTTTYKNNAKTCLKSKLTARLLSGLSCGQSRTPARTVFIRDVTYNGHKNRNL